MSSWHFYDLFPAKIDENLSNEEIFNVKTYFTRLGYLMGRSILDNRQMDMNFSNLFFEKLFYPLNEINLWNIKEIDQIFTNSIFQILEYADSDRSKLEGLGLTFTWMEKSGKIMEICPDGSEIIVNEKNIHKYIRDLIRHKYIRGYKQLFSWIREGLSFYIPILVKWPKFFPEEVNGLF